MHSHSPSYEVKSCACIPSAIIHESRMSGMTDSQIDKFPNSQFPIEFMSYDRFQAS